MEIKVGDTVNFTWITRKGKTISMTNKTGIALELGYSIATVLVGNKTKHQIDIDRLRKVGQKTRLTEFTETIFAANREGNKNA